MPFSWLQPLRARELGKRGGQSKSEPKQAAARINGHNGGRPRKQELEPPLARLIRDTDKLAPVDPRAGRAPLDVLKRGYVTVVIGAKVDEAEDARSWEENNRPALPYVVRRKIHLRKIAGFTQLHGEAMLTRVMPTIEEIDNYLAAALDGLSRHGARKSTRERERLRVVRAVYWLIRFDVEGRKVSFTGHRLPRDPAKLAEYIKRHPERRPDEWEHEPPTKTNS